MGIRKFFGGDSTSHVPKEDLVGPRSGQRESKLDPQSVQLEDGTPLYHALLNNPDSPVMDKADTQQAKSYLAGLAKADPKLVLTCQDKTLEQAQAILKELSKRLRVEEDEKKAA